VSGGSVTPEFYNHNSAGYEAAAMFSYMLHDSLHLTVSCGYDHWQESLGPGGAVFYAVPLFVGLRFPFTGRTVSPYLSGEIGMQFINRKYTLEVYDQGGAYGDYGVYRFISSGPASESVSRLALRVGAGIAIRVDDALAIEIGTKYSQCKYDYVYQEPTGLSKESVCLFSLAAGVIWEL
jgi:hypothetical protein